MIVEACLPVNGYREHYSTHTNRLRVVHILTLLQDRTKFDRSDRWAPYGYNHDLG
jgi:hypothetical protein